MKTLKTHYDILLIGAGLYNAVLAYRFIKEGKSVLVLEKRNHIAGNCYTRKEDNITIHQYGAHIFHTSNKEVWNFVNKFTEFNNFINSPIANYNGEIYNLPFNMNTFSKMFNVSKPKEVLKIISDEVKQYGVPNPKNLEEQAISLVGKTIYTKLIKEYTEKQWGRECKDLDPSIIKRLPIRTTYNNNYFDDIYQGIPVNGYTEMIEKMFNDAEIYTNIDFLKNKEYWINKADRVYYSGCVDEFFNYEYGTLEYRNVKFEIEKLNEINYQGVAVMNFTSHEKPYTRIIEHKHFNNDSSYNTIISKEYSSEWKKGEVPYYPINSEKNNNLYNEIISYKPDKIHFVGRLGLYKYMDMDDIIEHALKINI